MFKGLGYLAIFLSFTYSLSINKATNFIERRTTPSKSESSKETFEREDDINNFREKRLDSVSVSKKHLDSYIPDKTFNWDDAVQPVEDKPISKVNPEDGMTFGGDVVGIDGVKVSEIDWSKIPKSTPNPDQTRPANEPENPRTSDSDVKPVPKNPSSPPRIIPTELKPEIKPPAELLRIPERLSNLPKDDGKPLALPAGTRTAEELKDQASIDLFFKKNLTEKS